MLQTKAYLFLPSYRLNNDTSPHQAWKMDFFKGRKIAIATRHKKEKVIAPLLEKELGLVCVVPDDLDTDSLGTFTGEIERANSPVETARKKCRMVMDLLNCNMAIASEGSFGPHPAFFFANSGSELLLLVDSENDFEILHSGVSLSTNFNGTEITNYQHLQEFAASAGFPSHALILRPGQGDAREIIKGISSYDKLKNSFYYFLDKYGSVYAETDMRAMHNPTRMNHIEEITLGLLGKIKAACPVCHFPGFETSTAKPGLPCSQCGLPTRSVLSTILSCKKCGHHEEVFFPNQVKNENPMYCDFCNP